MIYTCFNDEWYKIQKFQPFSNFDQNHIPGPQQKSSNWLILKFLFIHCKIVKVSPDEQTQL